MRNIPHFCMMWAPGPSINLKKASFVHLLDTGGQPSFQDALPLLLDVPCTYIQVFNAAQDLDQPVPITYRRDEHTEESLPANEETGWKMMLCSFSSNEHHGPQELQRAYSFSAEGSQLPSCGYLWCNARTSWMKEAGSRSVHEFKQTSGNSWRENRTIITSKGIQQGSHFISATALADGGDEKSPCQQPP